MEGIHLRLIVKNQGKPGNHLATTVTSFPVVPTRTVPTGPAEPDCNRTADNAADHNMHCYDLRVFGTEGRQERILLIKTNQSKYKIL